MRRTEPGGEVAFLPLDGEFLGEEGGYRRRQQQP